MSKNYESTAEIKKEGDKLIENRTSDCFGKKLRKSTTLYPNQFHSDKRKKSISTTQSTAEMGYEKIVVGYR